MDENDNISNVMTGVFSKDSNLGSFKVAQTLTDYSHFGPDDKADAGFTFMVENASLASDPIAVEKHLLQKLKTLEPLKPYLTFESRQARMDSLADKLESFRQAEVMLNRDTTGTGITTIPDTYSKWFRELLKREDWNLQHALNVTKNDDGLISIRIDIPKDVDPETIVQNFEGRKAEIVEGLAKRTAKYTGRTDKDAVMAEVKALNVRIYSSSNENSKTVNIDIMPQERFNDMNQPGGVQAAKAAAYAAQNPLMALQNGEDDKDPEKPQPHLKKALARSFLTTGAKYVEIFHLIAGKEDMHREVAKSLVKLKNRSTDNTALCKEIDEFLNDDVFKDRERWNKPVEEREDFKRPVAFDKVTIKDENNKDKRVIQVRFGLPADKFPEIRNQIAALGNDTAIIPPASPIADAAMTEANASPNGATPIQNAPTTDTAAVAAAGAAATDNAAIAAAAAVSATAPDGTNVNGAGAFAANASKDLLTELAAAGPTSLKDRATKDPSTAIAI